MAGGLAVISDVPKTSVYRLARYINRDAEVIPNSTIDKPPSAELKPGQVDQDTLPSYDLLDRVLQLYVEENLSAVEIIGKGLRRHDSSLDSAPGSISTSTSVPRRCPA